MESVTWIALAVAGVVVGRKERVALVGAAMLISEVAVSYVLRAMNQPRHWILILPALLLLATECLIWLKVKTPRHRGLAIGRTAWWRGLRPERALTCGGTPASGLVVPKSR
jgi:H+/Cl- antiporter ClcA